MEKGLDVKVIREGQESLSILDWLEKAKERWAPLLIRHAPMAKANTDAYHGRNLESQGGFYAPSAGTNKLRHQVLTRAARVREEKPTVKAWPGDGSYGDEAKSKVANAVIEHLTRESNLDAAFSLGAIYTQLHGTVAFMPWWNPDIGKKLRVVVGKDELGNEITEERARGGVCVEMKTIFDFMMDPTDDPAKAKWCVYRSKIDENTARMQYEALGIVGNAQRAKDDSGKEVSGVEVYEIWHVPDVGAGLDLGMYARVVGGNVVEITDHPYDHKELPICLWHECLDIGSPIGSTHVDDSTQLRNYLNELCEQRVFLSRTIAQNAVVLVNKKVAEQLGKGSGVIAVDNLEQLEHRWLSGPVQVLQYIEEQIRIVTEELYTTVGVSEALATAQNIKASTTGRALDMARRLDSQKLSHTAENFNAMVRRLFTQALALTQQYVVKEDIARMVGENGEMEAVAFIGEDLRGFDVIIEPTSGLEQTKAGKAESTLERTKMGFVDPQTAKILSLSGAEETPDETLDVEMVDDQIETVLRGGPTQLLDVSPGVALSRIRTVMAMIPPGETASREKMMVLFNAYKQRLQESAAQAQQQQAPQPRPPQQGMRPQ